MHAYSVANQAQGDPNGLVLPLKSPPSRVSKVPQGCSPPGQPY